MILLFDLS